VFAPQNKKFLGSGVSLAMINKVKKLHLNNLPIETKKALYFLSQQAWLKKSNWYLAGGTALALQAEHRKSFDLDFFTQAKNFIGDQLLANFSDVDEWHTDINEPNTVYGTLLGAKVSFIAYPFFIPAQEPLYYGSVRIINALDVAVMKIIAVSQRGRKRDFYDLFWCVKHLAPLEEIIRKLPTQYPNIAHNYNHILTSLVYFTDAESDPEPEIYFMAEWKEIKNYFNTEMPRIAQRVLELS